MHKLLTIKFLYILKCQLILPQYLTSRFLPRKKNKPQVPLDVLPPSTGGAGGGLRRPEVKELGEVAHIGSARG